MVWFQCEDCGENLKKPKLSNHFRSCSSQKLSCIDCGVIFNQQSVQGHTQCVSEAEKYGPKTGGHVKKEINKENTCEALDCSLGLSARAPWRCSLCNIKATSQETLLLHSQGRKHQSKVRAQSFKMPHGSHALHPITIEEKGRVSMNDSIEMGSLTSNRENDLNHACIHEWEKELQPAGASYTDQPNSEPGERKIEEQTREKKCKQKCLRHPNTPCDGHLDKNIMEISERKRKKLTSDCMDEAWIGLVKWKKMIKKALKNAPMGSLKMKELQRFILPSVLESGLDIDEARFSKELERRIQSSRKYVIDGKTVRLAL